MKKTAPIILGIASLIIIAILLVGNTVNKKETNELVNNVEIRDGIQYVTINARGGYSPRLSEAKSGIPTKLIVKTNGTYDCSTALVIRSIGFQKILPNTGSTEIDLGTPKENTSITGMCSMGMYNFIVNF